MNTGDESSHTTVVVVMRVVSDTRNVRLRVHFSPWNLFIQLHAMALIFFTFTGLLLHFLLSSSQIARSGSLFQQTSSQKALKITVYIRLQKWTRVYVAKLPFLMTKNNKCLYFQRMWLKSSKSFKPLSSDLTAVILLQLKALYLKL